MDSYYSRYTYKYRHNEPEEEEAPGVEESKYHVVEYKPLVNPPLPSRRSHMLERARYIPLRLSSEERNRLHLLESTLQVSQYTDQVDANYNLQPKQLLKQKLKSLSAVLSGLLVSSDYKEGQRLISDKEFAKNAAFFKTIFEVGRRHKIMNPEKMRSEYGKLVFLIQDAVSTQVQELLGFKIKMGVKTVYDYLEGRDALDVLRDPNILIATEEILPAGKERYALQKEIKHKEKIVKEISNKCSSSKITPEEIKYCLYSLTDNNSFLNSNAEPIQHMLDFMKLFSPTAEEDSAYSLDIVAGVNGARLTHSHENQFNYVQQSLMLWKEIMDNMFMLWFLAEDDLLNEGSPYEFKNTGQGFHRVQPCPQVARAMQAILTRVQGQVIKWIGSSVVHLGDHNVPNALVFIDKYTQIPRILIPIVTAVNYVDKAMDHPGVRKYIETAFGTAEKAKKSILVDFFRYGFDGSGADNFVDAGSCIDGRLTSAWNWCSKLEEKKFYPIFQMSGFIGFDGDFQK